MKIAVAGLGYVGMANAVLLAQHNRVVAVDIDAERVSMVNNGQTTIVDPLIAEYLAHHDLDLRATTDPHKAYDDADFVVIATPTNYDPDQNYFDTSSVDGVLDLVQELAPEATIVIKSTIPVGFVEGVRKERPGLDVIFSPEFLREGKALYDNVHPSRIVVGSDSAKAHLFADLMTAGAVDTDIPVLFVGATEAEAIKLFANTYLAMRVSFFNELDTYASQRGLSTRQVIDGVCLDPPDPHSSHRRLQHGAQGLHRLRHHRQESEAGGYLPTGHEGRLGQLPLLLDPRGHEAHQGQGHRGRRL